MIDVLRRIAWRLALCAGISWLAWRLGGMESMITSLALLGLALARPLIDLASELRHGMRAVVWRKLEGRHFVYRGTPVQVLEDDDHRRWVRAADVRRIIGHTASNGALALTYPSGWRTMGRPAEPHFSDEALIAHLMKESTPEALRFRHWAEREIAFPAKRLRERLGIRPQATDFQPSD
ncbi:MAG: hypothetical protein H7Y61_15240 [Rhizobiales bacterium]|nr:hypothetical protein [Rhizobacter sp.]